MKEIKKRLHKIHQGNETEANKKHINNADSKTYRPFSFRKATDVGTLGSVPLEGTCPRNI